MSVAHRKASSSETKTTVGQNTGMWSLLMLEIPAPFAPGVGDVSGGEKSLHLPLWNLSFELFTEDQKQGHSVTQRQANAQYVWAGNSSARVVLSAHFETWGEIEILSRCFS